MARPVRSGAALLALAAATSPAHVLAQQADPVIQLPPTIVTATKREQDPERVDALIGVARPEELEQRNVRSVDQLDRVFPDVNIRQRGARVYSNMTVRGQSSPDFYNPSVQVLVDGLPQDQATFFQFLPLSLDRVELLYGPQGTLYGRGAVGGVFSIVTRQPDNILRGQTRGGFGNLRREAAAWLSGPIVNDRLYGDITLAYERDLGQYRQPMTGARLGDSEQWNGQVRLRYAPTGSPLDVTFMAARGERRSDEEQFVPEASLDTRQVLPVPSHYRLSINSFGFTASYDLGFATLTSLTGYQDRSLARVIFGIDSPEDQSTVSQELRLVSNPGRRIDYVVGAYFQNIDFEFRRPQFMQTARQTIRSYALFGEATWHATERFDVTPGLRIDYETSDAEASGGVTLSGTDSFSGVSPKLAFGYQVSERLRLYALYSSGFRAGGFTRVVTPQNVAFSFSPQRSHNLELGTHARFFGNRLRLSAAAYYTYTTDYQLFVGNQPNQYLQNVGDVAAKGFDLRVVAIPVDALRITLGLGVNDTRFVSYDNPVNPGQDLEGNRVPYAPPVTFNLAAEYTIDLPRRLGQLVPFAGMTHVGKVYFDETNTVGQGAYTLFNAGLTWAFNRHVSAEAYIDNIGNRTYTVYGFNGGPGIGRVYQLGRGREGGVRLSLSF